MHVLGLDLGTTHIKAARFEIDGASPPRLLASHAEPVELDTPLPGRAEQDPARVLAAARVALDAVGPAVRLGVSGAMHSLLLLDAAGVPLANAITWADQRAAPQAEMLRASGEAAALSARSGTPVHAMSPFCKLLWMRDQAPEQLEHARLVTGLKEYVTATLSGVPCAFMDRSMASATGLYDIKGNGWDDALLARLGLNADRLPRIVETTAQIADGWVAGGGDGPLSNLGCGAVAAGSGALTVGTSGAIRECTRGPSPDPLGRTFCYHLAADLWVRGGAISSGGVVIDWAASMLGLASAAEVLALAADAPAGADGVIMVPYLAGERAPHWDAGARASVHGLRLHHGPRHFARAAVEATAFAIRDVLEALPGIVTLTATGGFTRSPFWLQTVADVTGRPLGVSGVPEAAALGAALLAVSDWRDVAQMIARESGAHYDPRPQPVYDERFAAYRALYAATRGIS